MSRLLCLALLFPFSCSTISQYTSHSFISPPRAVLFISQSREWWWVANLTWFPLTLTSRVAAPAATSGPDLRFSQGGWEIRLTDWPCGPGGHRAALCPWAREGLCEDTHWQQHESPSEEHRLCQSHILQFQEQDEITEFLLTCLCLQFVRLSQRLKERRWLFGQRAGRKGNGLSRDLEIPNCLLRKLHE